MSILLHVVFARGRRPLSAAVAVTVLVMGGAPACAQSFVPSQVPVHPACNDPSAKFAAFMTYLEAELRIDENQRFAWEAFAHQVALSIRDEQVLCLSVESPEQPTDSRSLLTRLLTIKEASNLASFQSLKRLRLALQALFPVLRPEQQEQLSSILIRAFVPDM